MKSITHLMAAAGTDVSPGGIYVLTTQDLPVGTLVDVEFTVDALDRSFHALAEVRWHQKQPVGDDLRRGLGLKFLDLPPEDRDALETFVRRREPVEVVEPDEELPGATDDRRAGQRVPISTRVRLKTVANLASAAGTDLSVGGIYLVSSDDFELGTEVDLEFTVEEIDGVFQVAGTVKWRQRQPLGNQEWYGLGIEFDDLSEREREQLERFVELREPVDPAQQFTSGTTTD